MTAQMGTATRRSRSQGAASLRIDAPDGWPSTVAGLDPRPCCTRRSITVLERDATRTIGRGCSPDEHRLQGSRLRLSALTPVTRHREPIVGSRPSPDRRLEDALCLSCEGRIGRVPGDDELQCARVRGRKNAAEEGRLAGLVADRKDPLGNRRPAEERERGARCCGLVTSSDLVAVDATARAAHRRGRRRTGSTPTAQRREAVLRCARVSCRPMWRWGGPVGRDTGEVAIGALCGPAVFGRSQSCTLTSSRSSSCPCPCVLPHSRTLGFA